MTIEDLSSYAWIFPAVVTLIYLIQVVLASWKYHRSSMAQDKHVLDGARKSCILWGIVTAVTGAISIAAIPYLTAR